MRRLLLFSRRSGTLHRRSLRVKPELHAQADVMVRDLVRQELSLATLVNHWSQGFARVSRSSGQLTERVLHPGR